MFFFFRVTLFTLVLTINSVDAKASTRGGVVPHERRSLLGEGDWLDKPEFYFPVESSEEYRIVISEPTADALRNLSGEELPFQIFPHEDSEDEKSEDPTAAPTTGLPTVAPTQSPTNVPTGLPTVTPTQSPSAPPSSPPSEPPVQVRVEDPSEQALVVLSDEETKEPIAPADLQEFSSTNGESPLNVGTLVGGLVAAVIVVLSGVFWLTFKKKTSGGEGMVEDENNGDEEEFLDGGVDY